jgi:uncharacterized membrane protein YjjP (DUF1212 family)
MSALRLQATLLLKAGRLLLEYNESTATIHRVLTSTAKALSDQPFHAVVSYGSVAIFLAEENLPPESVSELRYNTAVQARVHEILVLVRHGQLSPEAAVDCLDRVEADTPKYARWLVALALGAAAACLAGLLGADGVAAAFAGLATALGLFVRRELGLRHLSLLSLPFAASLVGAILGGIVIQLGWTETPGLAVVVPALMVVPGPHLINGILDLIDNHVTMGVSRLGIATGILLASAAGISLGVELTFPDRVSGEQASGPDHLNLAEDVLLAGIVACGFAMFYNTAWRHLWLAVVGGMAGHGLRFLALEAGCRLEVATFLGGLTVGLISAWVALSRRLPVAVISFAGAVTMVPGLSLYRGLAGALQLARAAEPDPVKLTEMLGNTLQGCLVVSALTLGLILGVRSVLTLARAQEPAIG